MEGTEETVRVVAMEKDFHVDCYVCEVCEMQLTDEPDKRCYPLQVLLISERFGRGLFITLVPKVLFFLFVGVTSLG